MQTQEFYYFDEFKMDAEECRLWHGEELVPLTPKEFEVLFYLVERAGQVAEKNDLLDAIWKDTFVEESTLARNVSWLRKKLKKYSNGSKIIETVPKRGYRLSAEVTRESSDYQNEIIIEEQTVRSVELEETFAFPDDAPTSSQNAGSVGSGFPAFKTIYLLIGFATFVGIGYLAYQGYAQNYFGGSALSNATSGSPRLVNLALGKATKQSSNFEKNRGLSYEAVDGNTNGSFFQASVAVTGDDRADAKIVRGTTDPWWEVDLGDVY
ncbi:MAG: transcriptional regulator, partial [Acidobacteria bacterium]|nr:transcriptional regulator [Acidobacteriota bacterium]